MTPSSTSSSRFQPKSRLLAGLSYAGLTGVALLFLFPFFWMVSNAIRGNSEVVTSPPRLLPRVFEWGNFAAAWLELPFGRFFLNSFIVSTSVTALTIVISVTAGYAFARLRFAGRDKLMMLYLSTLMIPGIMLLIPLFIIVSKFGWLDTYQGLIVPAAFSSFGVFLMRQFFMGIPKELEEAARIDGATRLRILVSIMVPLAMPAIGLLSLFTFISSWNNFLWPLVVTNGPDKATLPLGLTLFQTQQGTAWNFIMAGATISMLPGIILAVLLQNVIYKGISTGSGFGGR